MPEHSLPLRVGMLLFAAVAIGGCESTMGWLKGRHTATPDEAVVTANPESGGYLAELYRLANGDPATQAEIFAEAEAAATLTPSTETRLRYALVLAAAGHAESNPGEAQGLLRDLLAQPELMNATELALAAVFLKDVEARLVLDAETRRMRADNARSASSEAAANARRIADMEAENGRLRQSLQEAEAKLDAITSIERSIRQQNGENETH